MMSHFKKDVKLKTNQDSKVINHHSRQIYQVMQSTGILSANQTQSSHEYLLRGFSLLLLPEGFCFYFRLASSGSLSMLLVSRVKFY